MFMRIIDKEILKNIPDSFDEQITVRKLSEITGYSSRKISSSISFKIGELVERKRIRDPNNVTSYVHCYRRRY